jgi:hypothetical protein
MGRSDGAGRDLAQGGNDLHPQHFSRDVAGGAGSRGLSPGCLTHQEPEISFTGLAPSDDAESALFAVLAPGNYTAIVRGKDEGTGIALVEVYQLNN